MKARVRLRSRRSLFSGILLLVVLCWCSVRYFDLPAERLLSQFIFVVLLCAVLLLPAALLGAVLQLARMRRRRREGDGRDQSSTN